MTKNEILRQLRDARKAHIAWVQRAKSLVAGIPLSQDQIPLNATECKFGTWFYEEGVRLKKLPGFGMMDEIERLHMDLHNEYMKIFQIFFVNNKQGLLSKLFGFKKKKVSEEERKKAEIILEDLEKTSEQLLEKINMVERRIDALQENVFEKL